ncbi:DUF4097 domain-containing protein [candidate division WOR-3 bacterium]|uniref:DUF4097 domain-containing protein n=1 Tax=candidate division WOR-3 bacterium TaxID=2052148 RepID=A0A938BPD0_UNCW3|nr:DUF4097 domain-containing protein [candidate division WOR-3 bacterium]
MSNERDRILRLLEDGKITADQATRLIEALGSERPETDFCVPPSPPFGPRHFRVRGVGRGLDRIPDVVATAVASAMKNGYEPGEERSTDFPGKRYLLVKSVSGDLEVTRSAEERIGLSYSGGAVKVRSSGDQVVVRTMAGDVSATVPAEGRLELEVVSGDVSIIEVGSRIEVKTVSGDVDISQTTGDAQVRTVSGDVNLDRVSGSFVVQTRAGDVDLVTSGPVSGSVSTKSGDVTVALGSDPNLVLEMAIEEDGDISVEESLPHEVLEERERYMKVKFGAGSRTLVVKTCDGDIDVREATEK